MQTGLPVGSPFFFFLFIVRAGVGTAAMNSFETTPIILTENISKKYV
jgi:hypothetical protein